jgi:virginiamycin B lyase
VETNSNALGRVDAQGAIHEFPVGIENASLRGVTAGADGDLWFTANFANQIGHMTPEGKVRGVHDCPTPGSGPRCIMTHSSGRLFYGAFDAGLIGEISFD